MADAVPLGEQPVPVSALRYEQGRHLVVTEFPSYPMAEAYFRWLASGDAHEAFGTWADGKGL